MMNSSIIDSSTKTDQSHHVFLSEESSSQKREETQYQSSPAGDAMNPKSSKLKKYHHLFSEETHNKFSKKSSQKVESVVHDGKIEEEGQKQLLVSNHTEKSNSDYIRLYGTQSQINQSEQQIRIKLKPFVQPNDMIVRYKPCTSKPPITVYLIKIDQKYSQIINFLKKDGFIQLPSVAHLRIHFQSRSPLLKRFKKEYENIQQIIDIQGFNFDEESKTITSRTPEILADVCVVLECMGFGQCFEFA